MMWDTMMIETSVLIPMHDNVHKRKDVAKRILDNFVLYASTHFGGCSVVEGRGYYMMSSTQIQMDEWWKVSIITNKVISVEKLGACVTDLVNTICNLLDQESVMVTKNSLDVRFAHPSNDNAIGDISVGIQQ